MNGARVMYKEARTTPYQPILAIPGPCNIWTPAPCDSTCLAADPGANSAGSGKGIRQYPLRKSAWGGRPLTPSRCAALSRSWPASGQAKMPACIKDYLGATAPCDTSGQAQPCQCSHALQDEKEDWPARCCGLNAEHPWQLSNLPWQLVFLHRVNKRDSNCFVSVGLC